MRGFFSGLVSRRQRGGAPVEVEARGRNSCGSSHGGPFWGGSPPGSPELDIRIDVLRNSPPRAPPEPDDDDGRSHMVGAGNFGVIACSKEDFMQIQTSVMDAMCRAEAFGDDSEFAEALLQEIDLLFDEFEMLKQLLVRAHSGDTDLSIEHDALPLKQKLQRSVNDIVSRIVEREKQPRRRKLRPKDALACTDTTGAGRGIANLHVEGPDNHLEVDTSPTRRRVAVTDGTDAACEALDTLHL